MHRDDRIIVALSFSNSIGHEFKRLEQPIDCVGLPLEHNATGNDGTDEVVNSP